MVVQHNLTAMNANRQVRYHNRSSRLKSSEKLSSGYRINRAADDAAGLTISEKMRKQIRGLDQASTNAQDGVSSVQTAEGALTEVHSMLQRMNELATQAANGTNSADDRSAIQDEVDQLTTEIDRVAETTKFNEIYLLKGDDSSTKNVYMKGHDAGLKGSLTDGAKTATFMMDTLKEGDQYTIAGKEYPSNYYDIMAVYMVKHGIGDTATVMNDISKGWLQAVVNDMCSYTTSTGTKDVEETDADGNVTTVTKSVLYVNVTLKSYRDMISVYGFNSDQVEMLEQIMSPEFMGQLGYAGSGSGGGGGSPGVSSMTEDEINAILSGITDSRQKTVCSYATFTEVWLSL